MGMFYKRNPMAAGPLWKLGPVDSLGKQPTHQVAWRAMSENLIRLSQIINLMESAGQVNNPDSRHRILAQYREEASWHLRVLEEQEVDCKQKLTNIKELEHG